jgi:NAD+ kinase
MGEGGEPPLRRVGILVHAGRPEAVAAAQRLAGFLRARGVATRGLIGEGHAADEETTGDRFAPGLDLVLSIGGDGTLLRSAKIAATADVPLLGVKVGRVGFLTQTEPAGSEAVLERILGGEFPIEERTAITAQPSGAPWAGPEWALNEVIVEKVARHHLVRVAVLIGGTYVTTFSADGVIVATPTGSTAYAFSAGGPIVSPSVRAMLLAPVAPHMVFDRSIVVSEREEVRLEILPDEPGLLSADGRPGLEMPVGSSVVIRPAARPARLVRNGDGPRFFALLRDKFGLPGDG